MPKKYQPPRRQQPPKTPASKPQANTPPSHAHLTVPINWPPEIPFLKAPSYSKYVKRSQLEIIRRPPPPPAATASPLETALSQPVVGENGIIPLDFPIGPNQSVQIQRITDPNHPACGQCGLFAARDLLPGELILPYYGVIHAGTGAKSGDPGDLEKTLDKLSPSPPNPEEGEIEEDLREKEKERIQHENSDYDLWLSREADLAVDGEMMGNEARFVNDYRGVPGRERENAELRFVWDERIVYRDSGGPSMRNLSATTASGAENSPSEPGRDEDQAGTGTTTGEGEVRRGEWTMAVYVLHLGKKARQKMLEAQAKAEELQKKKLQQAQKKNAAGGGGKKAAVGGSAAVAVTTTKASSVGVIRKGEEILVSYGRGFWDRRRQEGAAN